VAVNFYEVMEIPFDATQEEIRASFRELARQIHPDTNPSPDAAEQFILLQKAFDTLADVERRQAYDKTLPATFTTPSLAVRPIFSRSHVQRMEEPQVLYALVRMAPPGLDLSGAGTPLNLCLVIDCSTSMQGNLLDTVKATAIELIRQLHEGDIISIVAFSDNAEIIVPAAANQDKHLLEASVRMLQTRGGTEIYKGLEAGYREIQRFRSKKFVNHIILITDGRTYGDEEMCLRLANSSADQNIGISGLGIGGKWNDAFLDQLTTKTGGSSLYVSRPKDVDTFLKQKVTGLGLSYAEHLEYELTLGEGVELRYAFRIQPELSPVDLKPPLRFGSVQRNTTTEIIFDFLIHPQATRNNQVKLAEGRLYFDIPSKVNPLGAVRLDLVRAIQQGTDPLPPPQAIIQAMSALTLYRIQERARQEVVEGKVKEATRRLQNLATHLLAKGERDLAQTVLSEAVHIQNQHSFTEDGEKRIKYGTRALLLPSMTQEKLV
jgi:Ca-activated chloride channel family protein